MDQNLAAEVSPEPQTSENGGVPAAAMEPGKRALEAVPLSLLRPSPYQSRARFEEKDLQSLSDSMKINGLLEPILIRRVDLGYEVIAGERRVRAAKQAGLVSIEAIVMRATDRQAAVLSLVENLHRVKLDPLEQALSFKQLTQEPLNMSLEEIALAVGYSKSVISRLISHLKEPAAVKAHLSSGKLTGRHVRQLKPITDVARKSELANRAAEQGWSSRELAERVAEVLAGPPMETPAPAPQPAPAQPAARERPAENEAVTAEGEARNATGGGTKTLSLRRWIWLCLALVIAGAALSTVWLAYNDGYKKEHPITPPHPASAENPRPDGELDQYTPEPETKGGERPEKAQPLKERVHSSPVPPSGHLRRQRKVGNEPDSSPAPQIVIPAARPPGLGGRIIQQ